MELALPLLALAGFYVVSNQQESGPASSSSKKNKVHFNDVNNNTTQESMKEGFNGMNRYRKEELLPNVNPIVQNYPAINNKELRDSVGQYINSNNATDKYFNQNKYQNDQSGSGVNVGNQIQQVYSLTGDFIDKTNFKHSNMVPFNGGKFKGQVYDVNLAETILDNTVGAGSQVIKKIEQAPLFKPQENMQWAYGAPNMSDFYQSRVNPGMKSNNVKPFETVSVGPGLNQGYGTEGSAGYNSGMEARNSWLPKTVDELRVATNPKLEYSLKDHEGPSYANVKNVGILGKVEKYLPDTFFIQGQDRWLTTTGQEKAQMLQSIQEVHPTARNETTSAYTGAAGGEKYATYVEPAFEAPKREELASCDVSHSSAANRGSQYESGERFQQSHTTYTTNRSVNRQPDTMRSGFGRTIGAVIAPLLDVIKPTRKEEVSANVRVYGDAGSRVPDSYAPVNPVPITIKETTLFTPNSYIGNQSSVGYVVNDQQPIANQRDTTNRADIGNPGGNSSKWGLPEYDQYYRQTNNESKEQSVVSRTNQGNTQMFNQQMHVNIAKIDSDRENNRMWAPGTLGNGNMPPTKEIYGVVKGPQQYDEKMLQDRICPDILDAFRANPYTFSLTNCA